MRKQPRQQRSRQLVDSLIEATGRALVEHGLDHTTTVRIAEIAGVSVGSLYQYFEGKEALVEALIEDARSEGFKIIPTCSYVAAQFDRHPEWADLRA